MDAWAYGKASRYHLERNTPMNIQRRIREAERHLSFLREVEVAENHLKYFLSLPKEAVECWKEQNPELAAKLVAKLEEAETMQDQPQELPEIKAFGKLNRGQPDADYGIVLAVRNRMVIVDLSKGEATDCGYFMDSMSTMSLEENCLETWEEEFKEK